METFSSLSRIKELELREYENIMVKSAFGLVYYKLDASIISIFGAMELRKSSIDGAGRQEPIYVEGNMEHCMVVWIGTQSTSQIELSQRRPLS